MKRRNNGEWDYYINTTAAVDWDSLRLFFPHKWGILSETEIHKWKMDDDITGKGLFCGQRDKVIIYFLYRV